MRKQQLHDEDATEQLPGQIDFFKYDPEVDGEERFDIDKALNENWDKINKYVRKVSDKLNDMGDNSNSDVLTNLKTYTEVEQLGLTVPTTTAEIFNAMPPGSLAIINGQHSKYEPQSPGGVVVTDQPDGTFVIIIFKYDYFRYQITAQESNTSDLGYSSKLYYGSLSGGNTKSGVRWIKIKNQDVHGENGTDLNSKTAAGNYFVMNAKNGPIGYSHFFVEVEVFYGGGFVPSGSKSVIAQTVTEYSTGLKFSRTKNGDNAWGGWNRLGGSKLETITIQNTNSYSRNGAGMLQLCTGTNTDTSYSSTFNFKVDGISYSPHISRNGVVCVYYNQSIIFSATHAWTIIDSQYI